MRCNALDHLIITICLLGKAQLHLVYKEDVDPNSQLAHVRRDVGVPLAVAPLDLLSVQIREDVVEE